MSKQVPPDVAFLRRHTPLVGANYGLPCETTLARVRQGAPYITISAAAGTGKTRIMSQMHQFDVHVGASNTTREFEERDKTAEFPYRHYHNLRRRDVRQYVGKIIQAHIPIQVEQNPANKQLYFLSPRAIEPGMPTVVELTDNARRHAMESGVFGDVFHQTHIIAPSYERLREAQHDRGNNWTEEETLSRAAEAYHSIGSAICDPNIVVISTDYNDTASEKVADVLNGRYPQSESDTARLVAISVHQQILDAHGEHPELGLVHMNYPVSLAA